MYPFFKYFHSGLRYLVLILVLAAIIQALLGWTGKKAYTEGNRKLNLFALISVHTQLLIGLVLYFLSPLVQFSRTAMKYSTTRYWTAEHITMMIVAITLITIGYSRSKKVSTPEKKHFNIFVFYLSALLIVVATLILSRRGVLGMSIWKYFFKKIWSLTFLYIFVKQWLIWFTQTIGRAFLQGKPVGVFDFPT